jgi:hypothetical protein
VAKKKFDRVGSPSCPAGWIPSLIFILHTFSFYRASALSTMDKSAPSCFFGCALELSTPSDALHRLISSAAMSPVIIRGSTTTGPNRGTTFVSPTKAIVSKTEAVSPDRSVDLLECLQTGGSRNPSHNWWLFHWHSRKSQTTHTWGQTRQQTASGLFIVDKKNSDEYFTIKLIVQCHGSTDLMSYVNAQCNLNAFYRKRQSRSRSIHSCW